MCTPHTQTTSHINIYKEDAKVDIHYWTSNCAQKMYWFSKYLNNKLSINSSNVQSVYPVIHTLLFTLIINKHYNKCIITEQYENKNIKKEFSELSEFYC